MATDQLTDWEQRHARRGRRAFAWAGGLVLLAGVLLAMLLPAGRGTCGLPPFGNDEFCRGNDRMVNAIVLFSAIGLSAPLFALASASRRAIIVGVVVVLASASRRLHSSTPRPHVRLACA